MTCFTCEGTGKVIANEDACTSCGGSGEVLVLDVSTDLPGDELPPRRRFNPRKYIPDIPIRSIRNPFKPKPKETDNEDGSS